MRRFAFLALTAMIAVGMTMGCTTNRKPRFNSASGEPEAFLRYTGRPNQDYIFRWNSKAFDRVMADLELVATPDTDDVLRRHGRPDFIRKNVRATRNEVFDEWAWWDRNVIVQFIEGQLVYEGELTDSDRWLITWGYPSRAYSQQYETGPRREIWIWEGTFEIGFRTASFTDGQLVYQAHY